MSHTPKLTMIGLYQYNNDVFSKLNLPSGIDKDTFIMSFLMKYGEAPVIYTNYDFMVDVIGIWSKKWYKPIERIIQAITDNYNPLHNFDRYEEYSDTENKTGSETQENIENRTNTGINTVTENTNSNSNTVTENTVSAYNANTYQPDNKQTVDNESAENVTSNGSSTFDENSKNDTNSDFNEDRTLNHVGHLYGNIGVTKSQDMLIDEISVRYNYNLYDIVSELLFREICVYIY